MTDVKGVEADARRRARLPAVELGVGKCLRVLCGPGFIDAS